MYFNKLMNKIKWKILALKSYLRGAVYICSKCGIKKKYRSFYPLYSYFGGECKCGGEYWQPKENRIIKDIMPIHEYYDYGLGKVIKGRKHRNEVMKQDNLIEVGTDWKAIKEYKEKKEKERIKKENKEWTEALERTLYKLERNRNN